MKTREPGSEALVEPLSMRWSMRQLDRVEAAAAKAGESRAEFIRKATMERVAEFVCPHSQRMTYMGQTRCDLCGEPMPND